MRLSPFKIFAIKVGVFSSVLLYLGIDLLAWHGPVWHAVYDGTADKEVLQNAPAVVYGEPVTEQQLARHTAEQDLLAGRTTPAPHLRPSRLLELVYATDLRTRTRYNDLNLPSRKEEARQEVARLASRYASEADFEAALASQGYTRQSFTDKVEARLRTQALIERAIAPHCQPTDADIADLYEQLQDQLQIPASRPVKHIFLATLNKDPEEVKARAEALLQRLQAGEDFAQLARENSEDERSAPRGGDLGEVQDTPQRYLPELPLFGDDAIAAGVPVLAQSRWGWHILLAGETTPASQATLEECKDTLRTALLSLHRELATQEYCDQAFKEDSRKKHIKIHAK